jgi:hypothetical protein
MIKGFSLQYVFAPDIFTEEMINGFINRMKKIFIKEKI